VDILLHKTQLCIITCICKLRIKRQWLRGFLVTRSETKRSLGHLYSIVASIVQAKAS